MSALGRLSLFRDGLVALSLLGGSGSVGFLASFGRVGVLGRVVLLERIKLHVKEGYQMIRTTPLLIESATSLLEAGVPSSSVITEASGAGSTLKFKRHNRCDCNECWHATHRSVLLRGRGGRNWGSIGVGGLLLGQ